MTHRTSHIAHRTSHIAHRLNPKKLFWIMLLIGINFANAQIRVGENNNVSVGSTNIPTQFKFNVVGNSVFLGNNTFPTSAAFIRGNSLFSNPTNPEYTWYGSDRTGIYHPNFQTIGFSSSGEKVMEISDKSGLINAFSVEMFTNNRGLRVTSTHSSDFNYGILSTVNKKNSKALAVNIDNNPDNFYVQGDGLCAQKRFGYIYSDSSYKTNITPIQNALSTLINLKGVKFLYKPEQGQPPISNYTLGFIAQDVLPFVPEVIEYNTETKYMVSYEQLIPLLTEAIKEQNTRINNLILFTDTLEKKIKNHKNQIKDLEELTDSLRACCKKKNNNNNNKMSNTTQTDTCLTCNLTVNQATLYQNRPNPFDKETEIAYILPEGMQGEIMFFDMTGKFLKTKKLEKTGEQSIQIQANEFAVGMYIYALIVNGSEVDTKRMIITQ